MSTRHNPQLAWNRPLEMAIVRLKAGNGTADDFSAFANALEEMADKATVNVSRSIGEIGQRAVGVMAAMQMVVAMIRDADGHEPQRGNVQDAELDEFIAGVFGERFAKDKEAAE